MCKFPSAQKQVEEAQRAMQGLRSVIDDAVNQTGEGVQQQVQVIERALEKELNEVMSQMGSALSSITGKFTNDYTKLVKEMSKVINVRV